MHHLYGPACHAKGTQARSFGRQGQIQCLHFESDRTPHRLPVSRCTDQASRFDAQDVSLFEREHVVHRIPVYGSGLAV